MRESDARSVAEAFLAAIEARDFDRARSLLADEDFVYKGPISDFENADAFIENFSRIGPIVERIERRRIFLEGDEVCVIFDVVTSLAELARTRVAQWIRVRDGRIHFMEMFFDAHAYESLFEQP